MERFNFGRYHILRVKVNEAALEASVDDVQAYQDRSNFVHSLFSVD